MLGTAALAVHDRVQRSRPVLRVYPVVGRFPDLLRRLREMSHTDPSAGFPFSDEDLKDIRRRALNGSSVGSFGTARRPDPATFLAADVAILPVAPNPMEKIAVLNSSGAGTREISVLNFGALGFGPVSANTIRAITVAAGEVGCHLNTGEDGLTTIHRAAPARLIWQVGTGYWGCRNADGEFCGEAFQSTAALESVDLIELKISQGAKPGAGGFLPAAKNTPRVARILGVTPGVDIVSPPAHSAFDSVESMLRHVAWMEELALGKPVGIKLCIGSARSVDELTRAMEETGVVPAFITVDGGEGGTGAASFELQTHAGLPVDFGLQLLDRRLRAMGARDRTRIFAAGRVKTGFDLFRLICRGADGCFFTRAPMIAMGCVQARRCHVGDCPSGIATQSRWRQAAVSPDVQGRQLARYYRTVIDGYIQLLRASGRRSGRELGGDCLISLNDR
ncbi:FMN-binding glutamate synthase family protein [Streptosporangium sp. NPDC006007]|uniref:FMN-binding glutamate synthase family protein n=1 Tax=Streptosporangium sp. NPDC006007 TaxID=3154575 RepID=UPI0033BB0247